MTDEVYNAMLPHKVFLKTMYECIDKGLQCPDPPRSVVGLMVESYQKSDPKRSPVDWGCSSCVMSALKQITIEFINYDKSKAI